MVSNVLWRNSIDQVLSAKLSWRSHPTSWRVSVLFLDCFTRYTKVASGTALVGSMTDERKFLASDTNANWAGQLVAVNRSNGERRFTTIPRAGLWLLGERGGFQRSLYFTDVARSERKSSLWLRDWSLRDQHSFGQLGSPVPREYWHRRMYTYGSGIRISANPTPGRYPLPWVSQATPLTFEALE